MPMRFGLGRQLARQHFIVWAFFDITCDDCIYQQVRIRCSRDVEFPRWGVWSVIIFEYYFSLQIWRRIPGRFQDSGFGITKAKSFGKERHFAITYGAGVYKSFGGCRRPLGRLKDRCEVIDLEVVRDLWMRRLSLFCKKGLSALVDRKSMVNSVQH